MTYARARLWLGISGVGFWVTFSVFGLAWQWGSVGTSRGIYLDLMLWLLVYAAIQLPLDWMGGIWIPRRHTRPQTPVTALVKGIFGQLLILWLAGCTVFLSGQRYGLAGALAAAAGLMFFLLYAQQSVGRFVGRFRLVGRDGDTHLVASADPAFVGGWVGLGPLKRLLLPAHWSREALAVQALRRQVVMNSGRRAAGLATAVLFNLAGLAVSALAVPGAGFANPGEFLHLIFGFTLWSFVGLLVLPSLSRPAVFMADRYAEEQGSRWQQVARELDQMQDDEPSRSPWVERIFHPIPSLERRLAMPGAKWGAWHAARMALYLSWAVPGLLSRSVHCNVGRPDLWVLFPGD
jgi:hypothetical protein